MNIELDSIPNDETGQALKNIAQDGSSLSKPMEIDFFVAVPSKSAGNKIALKVQELGYKISVEQDGETGDWTCYCAKTLIPKYKEVVRIEDELDSIAKEYNGYADGFGSYGNA